MGLWVLISEGPYKGCDPESKVVDAASLMDAVRACIRRFDQPALVEAFLPGREFTVGIVGGKDDAEVLGVAEITMNSDADQGIFSMRNKANQRAFCSFSKVTDNEAQKVAEYGLIAYHVLGCRDVCRLDFRSDAMGVPNFLEANPLAGLNPTGSDLPVLAALHGTQYDTLMARIIGSAVKRYGDPVSMQRANTSYLNARSETQPA